MVHLLLQMGWSGKALELIGKEPANAEGRTGTVAQRITWEVLGAGRNMIITTNNAEPCL